MMALSLSRLLILTVGPLVVVALAYAVAAPQPAPAASRPATIVGQSELKPAKTSSPTDTEAEQYRRATDELRHILPLGFTVLSKRPFLLAGDTSKARLQALHADVIAPVTRALTATYFERQPQRPITIVVCSNESLFRQLAAEWDGHIDAGYHGYYQRDKRRILLDLEAGNGSLAHELTHALSHSDCETLPEWFDEGLGALHEEATYGPIGLRLIGLPNWRCRLTQQAVRTKKLPSFTTLANPRTFRSGDVGLNYALCRSICLFLQDRQLLTTYYKALRKRPQSDANGLQTFYRVLGIESEAEAHRQFTAWVNKRQ